MNIDNKYKTKYLKYKSKYINLKNTAKINKGGMKLLLFESFDQEEFIELYNNYLYANSSIDTNSFEIFIIFVQTIYKKNNLNSNSNANANSNVNTNVNTIDKYLDINMLVGVTNQEPNDYLRFANSNYYSLYVDERDEIFDTEKQFKMFSVNYRNLEKSLYLLIEKIPQIHFDFNTSIKCPLNYLRIAEIILKPMGQIIWTMTNFNYVRYSYYDNYFYDYSNPPNGLTKAEIEEKYNIIIDIENKTIEPNEEFFIKNNILSPYIPITIDINYFNSYGTLVKMEKFKNSINDKFINFCTQNFPALSFELNSYTYLDFVYPVPIKIINENYNINETSEEINFLVNNIMELDERINYVEKKKITDEDLNKFSQRIIDNSDEFSQMYDKLNFVRAAKKFAKSNMTDRYLYLANILKSTLKNKMYYIVGTKKST